MPPIATESVRHELTVECQNGHSHSEFLTEDQMMTASLIVSPHMLLMDDPDSPTRALSAHSAEGSCRAQLVGRAVTGRHPFQVLARY